MKILFVTNYFPKKGGLQEAMFLFWRAKYLKSMGHEVSVLKWDQDIKDVMKKPYNILDLNEPILDEDIVVDRVHKLKLINPFFRQRLYKKIKKNYDVVHFHWLWSMSVLPEINKWGIPFVVTCHGSDIYRMGEALNNISLGRYINKKVMTAQMKPLNQANHVIFVSNDIQNVAKTKGAKPNAESVIPNGFNDDLFNINNRSKRSEITVGFIGNLIPVKRADKLPDIIDHIWQHDTTIKFIIIGDGHLRNKIEKDCAKFQGEVKFTGKISPQDVAAHLKNMDILMIPSRFEAFGCVIKEAQACGTMVVGSNNGGIPAVIGQGGAIVEDGDHFEERFALQVLNLIKTPLEQSLVTAAAKDYSWSETVKKELQIYQSIISLGVK
ncbi:MAG: glycosyltransferase [Candidatus Marinamargulisbacteria bacterium]